MVNKLMAATALAAMMAVVSGNHASASGSLAAVSMQPYESSYVESIGCTVDINCGGIVIPPLPPIIGCKIRINCRDNDNQIVLAYRGGYDLGAGTLLYEDPEACVYSGGCIKVPPAPPWPPTEVDPMWWPDEPSAGTPTVGDYRMPRPPSQGMLDGYVVRDPDLYDCVVNGWIC